MKQCLKCKKETGNASEPCPYDGGRHLFDELLGTVIDGKYKLEKCIGRGGMGAVYLATHIQVNNKVAIKVLLKSLIEAHPAAYDRFRREAQATGRIKHPNAVSVTDFGQTDDGTAYLAMEYVDGKPLRRLLDKNGKLSLNQFLNLAKQICAGISAAHKAGVIHRDIKPDNVMVEVVDNQEVARVLDFGIAKLRDSQQHTNLTETGALLGTPNYMSPEQCTGNPIDHRTDIYSLGVMFYQMISGELPFKAPNAPALIIMHVTQAPTHLKEICPSVPESLTKVIMQTLEKNPNDRQRSVVELIEQLEAALIPNASQWRVVYYGLLDTGDSTRQKFLQGIQQDFGISATQAEQIISSKGMSLKKTQTQADANKIADKLRSIGANVKVESIISEKSFDSSNNTVSPIKIGQVNNEPTVDPLLETDSYKMLSYVTEKAKGSTGELGGQTDSLSEEATVGFSNTIGTKAYSSSSLSNPANSINQPSNTDQIPTQINTLNNNSNPNTSPLPNTATVIEPALLWKLNLDGQIHENLTEETIEAWAKDGHLAKTDKICRGNGQWHELGTIPKFRRILDELAAQTKPVTVEKTTPISNDKTFFVKAAVVGGVFLSLYIGISLFIQYYTYLCVKDDTYYVLLSNKLNVATVREKLQERLKDRRVYIPDDQIVVTANYKKQNVAVSIDFKQPLLFIPIRYQVKRQNSIKITMDHLLQVTEEDKIELVGVTENEIEDYRKKKAEEEAAKAQSGYVADRPLNERDALILELGNQEKGILPSRGLIRQAIRAKQEE
ncbi:MAG: serine/threonine-protein kinase [Blastocatellia bacterium]